MGPKRHGGYGPLYVVRAGSANVLWLGLAVFVWSRIGSSCSVDFMMVLCITLWGLATVKAGNLRWRVVGMAFVMSCQGGGGSLGYTP